ncbi:MAG: hypothetical protein IPK60_11460 [Sandaracinaceae bacterium]|nr:hypothetical protein [Sandaracinaceae bacterium]
MRLVTGPRGARARQTAGSSGVYTNFANEVPADPVGRAPPTVYAPQPQACGLWYLTMMSGVRRWDRRNLALFVVAALLVAFVRFFPSYEHFIPQACDEFGYLELADAFARGIPAAEHVNRPFRAGLLAELSRHTQEDEYRWMVAPHAYHVLGGTNRIINQYPPGTSVLLSAFPRALRASSFPLIVIAMWFAFSLAAAYASPDVEKRQSTIGTIAVLSACLFIPPLSSEIETVTSVAPTFGLLIAAGMMLARRPVWSVLLVSLSIVFRVSNIVILVPVALYALSSDTDSLRAIARRIPSVVLAALPGVVLVLLWQYLVTGSPFHSTYSVVDQAWAPLTAWGTNFAFYFFHYPLWAPIHLLLFMVAFRLRRMGLLAARDARWLVVTAALNYLFFIAHDVTMPYYPYASAILVLGALVPHLARLRMWQKAVEHQTVVASAVLALSVFVLVASRAGAPTRVSAQTYRSCFSDTDVVWAQERGTSVQYTTGLAAFRWPWGSTKARRIALRYLDQHHFRQMVWLSDLPVSRATIESDLDAAGLEARAVVCPELGTVLRISAPPR